MVINHWLNGMILQVNNNFLKWMEMVISKHSPFVKVCFIIQRMWIGYEVKCNGCFTWKSAPGYSENPVDSARFSDHFFFPGQYVEICLKMWRQFPAKNPSPVSSLVRIANFPQRREAEEVMGIVCGTKCSFGVLDAPLKVVNWTSLVIEM